MLGKRSVKDGKPQAKKRKWQEELDDDESESEVKITKADMEAWKATLREEEREERKERERQEREERDRERKRREVEEEKNRQQQEEEERIAKEVAEARKQAEERENELRRQEAVAPPGALPPDVTGIIPAGMNPQKAHLYKTTFCKRWEQGNCNFGAACHFAHGERDYRGNKPRLPGSAVVVAPQNASMPPPPPPAKLQAAAALNLLHSIMAATGEANSQGVQQAQWPSNTAAASTGAQATAWQQQGETWHQTGGREAHWPAGAGAQATSWQQQGNEAWHQPGGSEAWHLPGGGDGWQLTGDGHA